ncbi:MAG: DUF167 domain-containing protein [Methanoregulaceae archaeon]|nr:DUF167 domain-containing protein [Methanoregulaceae archaeon]
MKPDISAAMVEDDQGTILTIEVTPGCKREKFPVGYNTWRRAIGCHVSPPPVEGKANRAVTHLVAEVFSVSRDRVEILSGAGSSVKRVRIRGVSGDMICRLLEDLLEDQDR